MSSVLGWPLPLGRGPLRQLDPLYGSALDHSDDVHNIAAVGVVVSRASPSGHSGFRQVGSRMESARM
jgi:hypothetical protein